MAMTGRKIQADGNWKSLQISAELRDQGLLGIEELSDYSLVKVKNKARKAKTTITAVSFSFFLKARPSRRPGVGGGQWGCVCLPAFQNLWF